MRRFVVPLAVSLLVHAGFVAIFWSLPAQRGRGGIRPTAMSEGGLTLSLGSPIKRPVPPRRLVLPENEQWIDVEPQLILPTPSLAGGKDGPVVPAYATSTSTSSPSSGGVGPGSNPGGGIVPAGQTPLLAVAKNVQRVVYVVDRSISMGPSGALERARQELRAALVALPADTWFQVLAYNRSIIPLAFPPTGLAQVKSTRMADVLVGIDALTPEGATDHVAALRSGLARRPDVLFLITDADDLRETDVLAVTRFNQGRSSIHVIELCVDRISHGESLLARLAAANAGQYRRVNLR